MSDHAYEKALKKVKKKKALRNELIAFLGVSIGMVALNLLTSPGNLWFYWAIGPWGITLFIRVLNTFMLTDSSDWEERELRKELKSQGKNPDDYLEEEGLELPELEPEYRKNNDYDDGEFV